MISVDQLRVSRPTVRLAAVVIAVSLLALPTAAFLTHLIESAEPDEAKRVEAVSGPDRDGYTAITTQQFSATYPDAEMIVLAPNGSTVYVNTQWDSYFDIDPVPGEPWTVEYVASEDLDDEHCDNGNICTREVFVRENIRTGETEVVWSRITPRKDNTRVHDIDRINGTHIAVADIYEDSVFVYDTARKIKVWEWDAQRDFPIRGGGPFPQDWTHVNDVEVLPDGRLMASLRNQDSVVFLAPNGTLLSNWTLGQDDRHEILFEQHNPDYLPGESPAILVADSEKNRVVEFERSGTRWEPSWVWRDGTLQWPRDADRLPNNHTLITDTQGSRVIEIDESGTVLWTVTIGLPYEAERLSTGDESTGGHRASVVGLESRNVGNMDPTEERGGNTVATAVKETVRTVVPPKLLNGILFVLPPWALWWHVVLFVLAVADLLIWGIFEYRWSGYELRFPLSRPE
jgi:hypothetical protein